MVIAQYFYLWILVPDFDSSVQDGCVRRVDPVEEHHVGDLRVEGEDYPSKITGQANHCFPHLVGKSNA